MSIRKICTAIFSCFAALLITSEVLAETASQLKVVDGAGKTLVMSDVPKNSTATFHAAIVDKAGKPKGAVPVDLVDIKPKNTVATSISSTENPVGIAQFQGIGAGEYQLVIRDSNSVLAALDVSWSSTVASTTAAGAVAKKAGLGGVSAGTAGAAAVGGLAVAGGVAAAVDSDDSSSGEEAVPTPLPTIAPTPLPTATPRPPRPHRPSPASPS